MLNGIADTVQITGVNISNVSIAELISIFNNIIERKEKIRVCVTPVNCLVWANKRKELKNIYNTADLVLCDGVPVLWASYFLNRPLKQRITGLDLLPLYLEECARKKFRVFFLGAKYGVAELLKKKITEKNPDIQIVGTYSPSFADSFSLEENNKIINLINEAKPDILWVSLSAPKQDIWISENFERLNTHIAIGVGGAFEVTAGLISRAPKFFQRAGLEWLYRFFMEPRRLFTRYFVEAPFFIPLLIRQKVNRG